MGFGIRIAPGVRVGVSSRGVRTSVGPRIARVHVGAGRTGFSTGVGPISYSTTLGGGSRSYSSGGSGSYTRSYGPTPTQANKQAEAQAIESRIKSLTEAHKQVFSAASRGIAGRQPTPEIRTLQAEFLKEDLQGVGLFRFAERKAIKSVALTKAEAEKARLEKIQDELQSSAQKVLDLEWELLKKNDPETVMATLTDAFGDNEAKAAVLEVKAKVASVMVVAPDLSVLPERDWSFTSAGNLSVKKMTAKDRDGYYFDLVFSQLVATLNESFAVAPAIDEINLLLVRNKVHPKLGTVELECLGFGTAMRSKMEKSLEQPFPFGILQAATDYWENAIDGNLRLKAVDLSNEPAIKKLMKDVTDI